MLSMWRQFIGTSALALLLLSSIPHTQAQVPYDPICQQSRVWVWQPYELSQAEQGQLNRTLAAWQLHPLRPFVGCLQTQRYRSADLSCTRQGERFRQHCQLPLLPSQINDHHILFHRTTTAFSQNRHISLPLGADVSLLAHEIGHWLGFVDEYPLSAEIAERYCREEQGFPSYNLVWTAEQVMTEAELNELHQRLPWRHKIADFRVLGKLRSDGLWQLGSTPEHSIGLYATTTCAHAEGFTWRPVSRFTAMQYHDTNVWPALYLELAKHIQ